MTIEQTLERIAVALEKLAEQKSSASGLPRDVYVTTVTQETKPEPQRTRPGKKVEEPVQTEESMNEPDPAADVPASEIKFADLSKAWFGMLGKAREKNLENGDTSQESLAKTQVIAKRLMAAHCGGLRFSEATVKPENFAAFLADIEAEKEAIEALNG